MATASDCRGIPFDFLPGFDPGSSRRSLTRGEDEVPKRDLKGSFQERAVDTALDLTSNFSSRLMAEILH